MKYDFKKIEKKWQKKWRTNKTYEPDLKRAKKPFYNLMMFPYPSAEGLHVGNMYAFTGSDIFGRFKRMQGNDVFEPIGLDGFGIHSENYAMKVGRHPLEQSKISEKNFYRQLQAIGNGFAWKEKIETYDPEYYRWTQWIFAEMWKHGLAYRKKQPVNWCPSCKTVLADEQVIAGKCERCSTVVGKKDLEQWFFKITDYANRLLTDLEKLDWAEKVKIAQRNWIGKSEGAEIDFEIVTKEKPNFVLLHGWKGSPKRDFFPWLKEELEKRGYRVQLPELPSADDPRVYDQVEAVLKNVSFDRNTVLIGHSLGGVVSMKVLERLPHPIRKTVLVASFAENHFTHGDSFESGVFDWRFNFSNIKTRAGTITIIRDLGDDLVPNFQADHLAEKLGVNVVDIRAQSPHATGKVEPDILRGVLGSVRIFTTRPDTLFGATYVVLAPEHELISGNQSQIQNWDEVEAYMRAAASKPDEERIAEGKEKTGVQLKGVTAINPATKEEIPVWVADYVLGGYGTGAIMAVPAHDERDFEFAKKYKLPIKQVVAPHFYDYNNPPRKDKKTGKRIVVQGVVKHWNEDKTLQLHWKGLPWKTFVIGGAEEGETPEEAVRREVMEESGYQNFKSIKRIGSEIRSEWFADHKDENRYAMMHIFLVELADGEQKTLSAEESAKHTLHWVETDRIPTSYVVVGELDYIWEHLQGEESLHGGEGILINSGEFSEMKSGEAKEKIAEKFGQKKTQFRLRDWLISRQRYWGPPIPMIHCTECAEVGRGENSEMPGWYAVPTKELPVKLPFVENFRPTGTGKSPLATVEKFYKVRCPACNAWARRETDVSDTFLDSAWYYIGYLGLKQPFEKTTTKKCLPVDMYIGGAEHSVLHLLYVRFLAKAFKDWGLINFNEPMTIFRAHGLIVKDGAKMSKSKGNIVNPDFFIEKFGADTLRMYLMFLGPFEDGGDFRDQGILGPHRFLERVWKIGTSGKLSTKNIKNNPLDLILHQTIKKVTGDIENLRYNTAISALMILLNEFEKVSASLTVTQWITFVRLLAPFAPHIAEEIWFQFGNKTSIHRAAWPKYNPKLIVESSVEIIVQVNGKLRGKITVQRDTEQKEVERLALGDGEIKKWVPFVPKKVIFVPGRMINFVV